MLTSPTACLQNSLKPVFQQPVSESSSITTTSSSPSSHIPSPFSKLSKDCQGYVFNFFSTSDCAELAGICKDFKKAVIEGNQEYRRIIKGQIIIEQWKKQLNTSDSYIHIMIRAFKSRFAMQALGEGLITIQELEALRLVNYDLEQLFTSYGLIFLRNKFFTLQHVDQLGLKLQYILNASGLFAFENNLISIPQIVDERCNEQIIKQLMTDRGLAALQCNLITVEAAMQFSWTDFKNYLATLNIPEKMQVSIKLK